MTWRAITTECMGSKVGVLQPRVLEVLTSSSSPALVPAAVTWSWASSAVATYFSSSSGDIDKTAPILSKP